MAHTFLLRFFATWRNRCPLPSLPPPRGHILSFFEDDAQSDSFFSIRLEIVAGRAYLRRLFEPIHLKASDCGALLNFGPGSSFFPTRRSSAIFARLSRLDARLLCRLLFLLSSIFLGPPFTITTLLPFVACRPISAHLSLPHFSAVSPIPATFVAACRNWIQVS